MIGAFLYLIGHSTRNKLASQLRRLRNPRYAIGLILGLAYLGFIFWNSTVNSSRGGGPPPDDARLFLDAFKSLAALGLMALSAYSWIVGGDRQSLAFTQAEVAMLFPAPVTRRELILYKLFKAQTPVLFTSLLWMLLSRVSFERGISFWIVLTTISLHRLGIALVRASQSEHGSAGVRRNWVSYGVFGAALAIITVAVLSAWPELRAAGSPSDRLTAVLAVLHAPPTGWIVYPFDAIIAPIFTKTNAQWLEAVLPALLILILHFIWVIRSDAAFEESAAQVSAQQANLLATMRSRGLAATAQLSAKSVRRTLPLKPTGHPAVAIVWKNWLWLVRTNSIRPGIVIPIVAVVLVTLMRNSLTMVTLIGVICAAFAFLMFLFGPMTFRNDLRTELGRVSVLKSYPIPGRQILFAEIASSASAITAMQYLLFLAAIYAASFAGKNAPGLDLRIAAAIGAPLFMLGLNLANLCIHNGLALVFPAWVRVGDTGTSGIENMGSMMLLMIITIVMLALLSVVPAVAAGVIYFMYSHVPLVAITGAGLAAGAIFTVEALLVTNALGGMLDRLEPSSVS